MIHDRDMLWDANSDPKNRRVIKLRDMDDTHLANIIKWVADRPYTPDTIHNLQEEAQFRKLPKDFLDMAPFPKEEWGMSVEGIRRKRKPLSNSEIIKRRIDSIVNS